MKKSFIVRKRAWIELNFVKNHCPRSKACTETDSMKNAKNRQKNCQNRDLDPCIQAN